MAGISIECTGKDALRVERLHTDASDSVYLEQGDSTDFGRNYLLQVSAAEAGTPNLRLYNYTDNKRLDVYRVGRGRTRRERPLAPWRSRALALTARERLLLIAVALAKPEAAKRRGK
jgi:hypothetical protein